MGVVVKNIERSEDKGWGSAIGMVQLVVTSTVLTNLCQTAAIPIVEF